MKNFSIKRIIAGILSTIMVMTSLNFMPLEVKAASSEWNFSYTGNVQEWTAPYTGKYYFELVGAGGGGNLSFGGKSKGYYNLYAGEKLYLVVGGKGTIGGKGGYNGGGNSFGNAGSGGGATSIHTTNRGILENYKDKQNEILAVAGGAGGISSVYNPNEINGGGNSGYNVAAGNGGGYTGISVGKNFGNDSQWNGTKIIATAGTQTTGYSFGKGQDSYNSLSNGGYSGAGGGGYYGGMTSVDGRAGGAGGSGYIGNLYNSSMDTSSNLGDGYVTISYIGNGTSTIMINTNGGGLYDGKTGTITYEGTSGSTYTLKDPIAYEGYTFMGWEAIYDDKIESVTNKEISFQFKPISIRAKWKAPLNIEISQDTSNNLNITYIENDDFNKIYKVYQSYDNKNWDFAESVTDDLQISSKTYSYDYTGGIKSLKMTPGIYTLEVWGAQGGASYGGLGGYSKGTYICNKNGTMYIVVGGQGNYTNNSSGGSGGYNGGGSGGTGYGSYYGGSGGGGATHIALTSGLLKNLSAHKDQILIVSGGGGGVAGGQYYSAAQVYKGGNGGGLTGDNAPQSGGYPSNIASYGGTQTTGYQFGQGQNGRNANAAMGGGEGNGGSGGGYYGGYASQYGGERSCIGGSGGSGYIGGLQNAETKNGVRSGNGYAKITYTNATSSIAQLRSIKFDDYEKPNKPSNGNIVSNGTKLNISWNDNGDNGTTIYHKVESYNADTGELLQVSETASNKAISGVKGYYYYIDTKSTGTVTISNGTFVDKNSAVVDRPISKSYMHIATVDKAGNISDTYSFEIPSVAAYKVIHQQEQLNGTYTTVETENLSGTIGSSVTPAVKSYTGFTSPSTQTVTISADGSTTVTYKYVRKTYDLDVNVVLDGTSYNTGIDGITFDVYVNGTKVGSGKDFCARSTYKYGSTYEIKNISCPGYTFDTSSSIKGTITANTEVKPRFTTNSYTVTYKDVVDSTSGTVLKETTASKKYGSSVRGTDIGSSTADNAYYNGYYYVSDTSATVGTSGATVYRIFKLRTINISGTVSWTDNSNKWSTRPNEVTISLYRDGSNVDSTKGLTNSDSNTYSFNNVPKYSTSDGHVYNYTVSQSEAVSKTSPEDKYTTTQNTYNFTNVLGNTDKDADNKGLTVKGSIYWEDKGDALGYRPKTVTITLYQNGKEYKTLEVDSFNDNTYEFSKLPKYDKDLNKYEYTVKETMVANYLVTENGQPVLKDAYSIKADTPNALDFTNVFNVPDSAPVPVKPEHINNVTVKTNTEDMITISLKGMETIINNDLSVSYGNNYNGQVYNLSANNIGTVLSSINSGKYEISYLDATYVLNDITCNGDNNIWIEGSGDKYYLVIKDTNTDVSGTITLNFSKKDHIGYQTDASVSNYFKVGIETTAIMSLESEVFAISDMIIEAEDAYSVIYNNSDTIDENIYNAGDEIEVLDYQGELPENKEFLGWALSEDAEEPDYLVGDIISIKDMNISLYPVFKDIEEEISEMESTEETTESSESIEESSETEESTMEETSSEEETTESEEISTENNFSEEAASTEEESSESSETIENSKLEK